MWFFTFRVVYLGTAPLRPGVDLHAVQFYLIVDLYLLVYLRLPFNFLYFKDVFFSS